MIKDYLFPRSVDEAIRVLSENPGDARIFAGGTTILQDGRKLAEPLKYFVDLSKIAEISGIHMENDTILLGANTTLTQCSTDSLIQEHHPELARVSGTIGSTQIRNVATVTGNILNGKPYSDLATLLIALDARLVIRTLDGIRETAIEDIYVRLGDVSVNSRSEIVTGIRIPLIKSGEGSSFQRLELRKGLSFSVLNVAVKVRMEGEMVQEARIVVSPLAPGPKRIVEAEDYLIGNELTEVTIAKTSEIAAENTRFTNTPAKCGAVPGKDCSFENCHYCLNPVPASGEYRRYVLPFLLRRALTAAADSAIKSGLI